MNGKKEEDLLSICFIINASISQWKLSINFLLIKCKVKNFMDINRQISAEKYVDVCIGNEEDADIVFGIKAGATDVTKGQLDTDGYKKSLQTVAETFGCKIVAYSQRKSYSASDNGWSGIIYDDEKKQVYTSAQYDIRITDRIGGGDAFASGLIYALHNNILPENAIETAAAAGCLDQTLEGDFCLFGINEVLDLANGDSSGRVKR